MPQPTLLMIGSGQALCLARKRYFEFRTLIDVISGVAFLGTPHSIINGETESNLLDLMLRSEQVVLPKHLFGKEDNVAMAELSRDFEIVDLQVPIISVYEERAARIQESIFARFRKSRQVVVS